MTGKIDKGGYLLIKRRNVFKPQFCPHGDDACGDWCPLFDDSDADIGEIQLCNGKRITVKRAKGEK